MAPRLAAGGGVEPASCPRCERALWGEDASGADYATSMCRNIQQLRGAQPPASEAEVRDAALQFVRKVSGYTRPSAANEAAFEAAVDEIAAVTRKLLDALVVGPSAKPVELRQRLPAR